MGKNLYSDFAVLTAAGRAVDFTQVAEGLRIIPLFNAISLVDAMKGNVGSYSSFSDSEDGGAFVPKNAAGIDVTNVTLQHTSDGYVRLIGKLVKPEDAESVANGFAIVDVSNANEDNGQLSAWSDGKYPMPVYAVASLKEGYNLGDTSYVAFTVTTVNNYKSVTFNPNAFATLEDLAEINGLDGLHIAFDTKSGDIKLLDKEGKVLDQANLHMDTDTIIAEGEEGYKYVKTDRDQDIHSTKSFMPAGKTSGTSVEAQDYEMVSAALLLDLSELDDSVTSAQNALATAEGELEVAQGDVASAQAAIDADDGSDPEQSSQLAQDLETAQSNLESAQSAVEETRMSLQQAQEAVEDAKQAARNGDFSDVFGIRVLINNEPTDYFIGGEYNNTKIGASDVNFLTDEAPGDTPELTPVYSPAAFVWTVGKDVGTGEVDVDPNFAQQMNANAQALGFHIGDDIPLGTNLPALIAKMSEGDFDAEAYMHDIIEMNDEEYTVDELVDEQRNLAKAELVAWNAQHPALVHDGLNGTIISEQGVDIKNGMLSIGNGVSADGHDFPKQFKISTNYGDTEYAEGLRIHVVDASDGVEHPEGHSVLTINDKSYISGAPICLALLKCDYLRDEEDPEAAPEFGVEVKRITADFNAESATDETTGSFSLNITDKRESARVDTTEPRVVEIIPVYRSGADATEAVPALQPIHAIGQYSSSNDQKVLSVRCTQVRDWAASLGISEQSGVIVEPGDPGADPTPAQSAELYLLVKVY